jgi:GT2 family glycosyltransferase
VSLSSLKTLVIIVNYKSVALTRKAAESALTSESVGPVHVVVVDNTASEGEAHRLRSELPLSVTLRINAGNRGFGVACNQAFDEFSGEGILLMNPDARLEPGCLSQLQKTLFSDRHIAAVSPQLFWDDDHTFYLPPPYPTALFEFRDLLISLGSRAFVNRIISLLWRKRSIKIWQSKKPVAVGNLSGGLALLKRSAVKKAGGLFDPRFFLYFEDTDLFLRLRKSGYNVLIDPKARAIHHYDQCGQDQWRTKRSLMAESYALFLEKHRNIWQSPFKRLLNGFSRPDSGAGDSNLPVFNMPFSLKVPPALEKGWLFEWSPNPDLTPSAGRFGVGPKMDFPENCWKMLAPGKYFGRLGGLKRFVEPFQQVSWIIHENF